MGAASPHARLRSRLPDRRRRAHGPRRHAPTRSTRASARSWSRPRTSKTTPAHLGRLSRPRRRASPPTCSTTPSRARLPPHPLLVALRALLRHARALQARRRDAGASRPTASSPPTRGCGRCRRARDRVLLVGDAAGRHSPLTFCGFGSMIRSFLPVADGLRARLDDDRLDARALASLWREPPGLQVMGGLTLMMVPGRRPSARSGRGQRAARRRLRLAGELGDDIYGAFVRDQIGFADFLRFMRATAKRRPTHLRRRLSRAVDGGAGALEPQARRPRAAQVVERMSEDALAFDALRLLGERTAALLPRRGDGAPRSPPSAGRAARGPRR